MLRGQAMRKSYVAVMDKLYFVCVSIGVISVVCMTGLIFTGVVMRYVFGVGAQFAEPMSIFFAVQLTMYGAAACYRARAHLNLQLFVNMASPLLRRNIDAAVHLLLAATAIFMVYYGISLTHTTWFQAYPEFIYIRVGFVYSAIPGSGLITLLFVIESAFFREPEADTTAEELRQVVEHGEQEARHLKL